MSHLPSRSLTCSQLPSSALICHRCPHLPSSAFFCPHLPSSAFLCPHLPPSAFFCPHLPSSVFLCPHSPPSPFPVRPSRALAALPSSELHFPSCPARSPRPLAAGAGSGPLVPGAWRKPEVRLVQVSAGLGPGAPAGPGGTRGRWPRSGQCPRLRAAWRGPCQPGTAPRGSRWGWRGRAGGGVWVRPRGAMPGCSRGSELGIPALTGAVHRPRVLARDVGSGEVVLAPRNPSFPQGCQEHFKASQMWIK